MQRTLKFNYTTGIQLAKHRLENYRSKPWCLQQIHCKGGKRKKDGLEAFNFKDVKDVSANCLCGQGFKQSIKNNGIYDSTEMHTMTEYLMI